ncbi:hypothetical protein LTR78_006683 [Recurvomyces mirabilis]|uniref:BRCT domain-containing protein n=1 Tax=Recurvomyces mirabilis TaxID=574656 RepID=A0AAE1BZU3_9PEZI|nr:hypothetical protein LTR78_006683 [Recurvomyces mirabilis]KAK5151428.1 hypothetical protein LTS14_009271 [Recurvomyces mirabilis]
MSGLADDGTSNIILRCMNTAGLLHDFVVPSPDQPATELLLLKNKVHFHAAAWRRKGEGVNDVLCQFRMIAGEDALLFESRAKDCEYTSTIQAAPHLCGQRVRTINSSRKVSSVIKLQLGSTIRFPKLRFQFIVMAVKHVKSCASEQKATSSSEAAMDGANDDDDTIVVASKQAGVEPSSQPDQEEIPATVARAGDVDTDAETEAEDGDDIEEDDETEPEVDDSVFSTNGADTSFKTPATAITTVDTLQKSPKVDLELGNDHYTSQDDDDLDLKTDMVPSSARHPDPHSPLTKKSQSQSQRRLDNPGSHAAKVTVVSDELGEDMFPSDPIQLKPKNTYGGKSRASTPRKAHPVLAKLPGTIGDESNVFNGSTAFDAKEASEDDEEQDRILREGFEAVDAIQSAFPTTSDRDEHTTAAETAARTIGHRKRKAAATEDLAEDEAVVTPPTKKPKGVPKAALYDEIELLPQRRSLHNKPASSSPRPQQSTERVLSQDSAENITVAHSTAKSKSAKTGKALQKSRSKRPLTAQVIIPSSARATPASDAGIATALEGKIPKVLITQSKLKEDEDLTKWLKKHGAEVIDVVPSKRTNFVCVVPDGVLPRTAKTLRSMALGKRIVTEDWLTDSKQQGQLLDPPDYIHSSLEDDQGIDRGKVFAGFTIFFTTQLTREYGKGWKDVQALVQEAGASLVEKGSATKGEERSKSVKAIVFIGSEENDPDVTRLIDGFGFVVYHKDLITESVLAGDVDLEDTEFVLIASKKVVMRRKKTTRS